MLHQFTWQQFLVAALILSLLWYGTLVLFFYRKEIREILRVKHRSAGPPEPLAHAWEEDYEDGLLMKEDNLIGKPALPEGMNQLSMTQFGFAADAGEPSVKAETGGNREQKKDFENETIEDNREKRLGLIPDVLEELKGIFDVLEKGEGNKQDLMSLFDLVRSKYPGVRDSAQEEALNNFIREHVLFPISDEELHSLWG